MKRIYLDYASITPVDPKIARVVFKSLKKYPANPSSLYREGVEAKKALESARQKVAKNLEVHSDEIFFNSGGTEGNNQVILGVVNSAIKSGIKKPHIIVSNIEHPSVLEVAKNLEESGVCEVSYLPVTVDGTVNPKDLRELIKPETLLISVMYANNEIGTIQPVAELAKTIRIWKKNNSENKNDGENSGKDSLSPEQLMTEYPYLHIDACQASCYLSLRIPTLGVDFMTLDGSKIYGPRGAGVLFAKRNLKRELKITPILHGGSQESDMRAGTENVANAIGFAKALEIAQKNREEESARQSQLRDMLVTELKNISSNKLENNLSSKIILNGSMSERLPNNINFCIPNLDSEFAVFQLDARGIAISSVTSCRAQSEDSFSYVVKALSEADADDHIDCSRSSLRITLGKYTKKSDIKSLVRALKEILK